MRKIVKLEDVLKNLEKMGSSKLRRVLLKEKIKNHSCEKCYTTTWLNVPIPLELHHKDGNHLNNNLDNLILLCPNCHALEPSFAGANKRPKRTIKEYTNAIEKSTTISEVCRKLKITPKGGNFATIYKIMEKFNLKLSEKPILPKLPQKQYYKTKYNTYEEFISAITKGTYPSDIELAELVWKKSIMSLSKEIGVSDNAIRHYCQRRNIICPPNGYWRKYETGRFDECNKIKNSMVLREGVEPSSPKA